MLDDDADPRVRSRDSRRPTPERLADIRAHAADASAVGAVFVGGAALDDLLAEIAALEAELGLDGVGPHAPVPLFEIDDG